MIRALLKIQGPDSKGGALISMGRESLYLSKTSLNTLVRSLTATSQGKLLAINNDLLEEVVDITPSEFAGPAYAFAEVEEEFDKVRGEYPL